VKKKDKTAELFQKNPELESEKKYQKDFLLKKCVTMC